MTHIEALKPCPFCGGEAILTNSDESETSEYVEDVKPIWWIYCQGCVSKSAAIGLNTSKDETIKAWNTRISTALKSGEQPTSEPVKVHPALLVCAEILEQFHKREVGRQDTVEDKLLQWQACYAMLFKQLNDASCVIREQDKQIKIMREALLEKSIKPT